MSTAQLTMSWSDQGTSIRMDVLSLVVALAIHAPLMTIKLDMKKKAVDRKLERLVAVDLIEPDAPKPPPPPVVKKKETGFLSKLKALVKKPPPPKQVKLQPKKLDLKPKEIKLDPKLKTPALSQAKLKSRAGFKTKADPKLVQNKKISLKSLGAGVAPLTAKKVGVIKDRGAAKTNKGSFQVAKADTLSGIGGGKGPSIGGPEAPTLAIRTGQKGSTEKFSAAAPQKANKGKFGGTQVAGLSGNKKLGLRDSIIARDAAPTAIGSSGHGSIGGVPGGVPGGSLATKKDAGKFNAKAAGLGAAGVGAGTVARPKAAPVAIKPKKKKKKDMFVITGPLKDRAISKRVIPEYPGWAQAQGIEAAVVLQFTVTPDGKVKDSIVVRRTSGYPRLDKSAIRALLQWVFKPLADGANREEVGLITFNYSLS